MVTDPAASFEIKIINALKDKNTLQLEWLEIERRVILVFTSQVERLLPLISMEHKTLCIQINLLYDEFNEKLAAFHYAASRHGNFIFEVNVHSFQTVDQEAAMHEMVLHELIHSLDIQVVLENRAQYLASKNFNLAHRKEIQFENSKSHDFSVQWAFLHFFATIRNEGVAILGTRILNASPPNMEFNEGMHCFASDVSHALGLCTNSIYYKRVLPETVQSTLRLFEHHAEAYADVLLYHFTFRQLPTFAHMSYPEFLNQAKSLEERLRLVASLFEFDLSDWIRALLKNEDIKNELSYTELFLLFSAFDRERKNDSVPLDLLNHGYNHNYSAFLSLLESCIDVRYDFDDLVKMQDSFFDETSYDDLLEDLKFLSKRIIELRDETNSDLVDLSLTYLFQKEDIIQDHSPIIGYQDDWIVLEGAYALLLHRLA